MGEATAEYLTVIFHMKGTSSPESGVLQDVCLTTVQKSLENNENEDVSTGRTSLVWMLVVKFK